nr:PEP/pyruvate-binding domain-containing protein [Alkalispirochaeta alkalica]
MDGTNNAGELTHRARIIVLDSLTSNHSALAGGKAVNLGEMLRAGLPVPPGFVISTDAYRAAVAEQNLDPSIQEILSQTSLDDADQLERAAVQIQALFQAVRIPAELREEITEAYFSLGKDVSVAVRSSSTAEDLPGFSFAGQYDSFLNVAGIPDLLDRIVRCWASLWNPRALSYRIRQGIGNDDLAHGVVVQKLVAADTSGILFTANPLNGRRDQLLLNASWGMGEAVVSGEVNPDQWVIDRESGRIVESRIARKEQMTIRRKDGISHVEVPVDRQEVASLSEEEISQLRALALTADQHFGEPQDIEWACEGGSLYLVQSRPVTSLYPVPETEPGRPGVRIYINVNSYSQAMQEPFTPIGEDLIRMAVRRVRKDLGPRKIPQNSLWYFKTAGGRFFMDITPFLRRERFWKKFRTPDSTDKDPITTMALLQYLEANRHEVLRYKERVSFIKVANPRLLWFLLNALREGLRGKRNARAARTRAIAAGDTALADIRRACESARTYEEKLDFIREQIGAVFMAGAGTLFGIAPSAGYIARVRRLMERHLGDRADLDLVEKAVPHSVTTSMGMELMQLAEHYDTTNCQPNAEDREIREFLDRYGHKKSIELDPGTPTWAEEPGYVLDLVRSYMENGRYRQAKADFARNSRMGEEAIDRICRRLLDAGKPRVAKKVRKLLHDFREMFGAREQSKFVITQGLQLIRNSLHDIGGELHRAGRLDQSDDVFFLRMDDLTSHSDLRQAVAENREAYIRNGRLKAPRLLTSTGEAIHSARMESDRDGVLCGVPVSPGMHEGRVRILHTPEEGRDLQKDEVLVTTGTNPAWTPLFLKVGALIMEWGGPISHGSVVAREYGLPAVAGVAGATRRLADGQRVRVDGQNGEVVILGD